jgi:hypothetical protein
MTNKLLQFSVLELLEASTNFVGYFSQAVAERLPSQVQENVVRDVARSLGGRIDSPIVETIHCGALEARLSIIAGVYEGDADYYIDAAVERSAARVMGMLERDGAVSFAK